MKRRDGGGKEDREKREEFFIVIFFSFLSATPAACFLVFLFLSIPNYRASPTQIIPNLKQKNDGKREKKCNDGRGKEGVVLLL